MSGPDPASTLHAIGEFLRLNARNAFALFAAGVALWLVVHYGIINHDPVEMAFGYVAAFGLFVGLCFVGEWIVGAIKRLRSQRAARAATQASLAQAEAKLAADAEARRKRSLENLPYLDKEEAETIVWMHHRQRFRIRASQHWPVINSLVRFGILCVDGDGDPWSDRFFIMPDHIREALKDRLGEPTKTKVADKPPWETMSRSVY